MQKNMLVFQTLYVKGQKMKNKANVYAEIYTILQDLEDDEYEKIPKEIIETLDKNRNKEYIY